MPRKCFRIAASFILAATGVLPVISSSTSPASNYKIIYSFTGGSDGGQPVSDLTLDSAGNLYGTTSQGGTGTACSGGCGTVFELKRSADGWKEEVLHSFLGGLDGASPQAGVIFDNSGNLYGTTALGGNGYGYGTVFKLTPNPSGGWTEWIIYSGFNCYGNAVGCVPESDLVFDAQGNLYGTTSEGNGTCLGNGCGAVFKLTPQPNGPWTETTLHSFSDPPDGGVPSGVVVDSDGSIYGLTTYGGTGQCNPNLLYGYVLGCGILYKLTPNSGTTWTETILYNFARGGGFGRYPSGALFFDSPNHLFGVTRAGGDGIGSIFELLNTGKGGWQESEAHIFFGDPDGARPVGRLVRDTSGNLIGVTGAGGGTNGNGIVYELEHSKSGWKERILHRFAGPQYELNPLAGVVSDTQGHLYGTTKNGGGGSCTLGCGKVYELLPDP
jgi:uncharacterized repeat protein (TIGR03803 family)